MIVAPHSLVDLDHILASRKPSNMEHRTESLLEVFTDTKALSNRSRHTAQSYTSGESQTKQNSHHTTFLASPTRQNVSHLVMMHFLLVVNREDEQRISSNA